MRVSVKRTGGYAGGSEDLGWIDTDRLDSGAAQQVEKAVRQIGFFNLPTNFTGAGLGADLFRYEVTVAEGSRKHTVVFEDDGGSESAPLRQLVGMVAEYKPG